MLPFKTIPYSTPTELRLHVYVAGYPCEGESILALIAQGDEPLLAIVTDCYNNKGYNHISHILRTEWNNHSVDTFIWTHPHSDHSKGIIPFIENHDSAHDGHIIAATNVVGFDKHPDIWNEALPIQKHLLDKYSDVKSDKYHFVSYDSYRDCSFGYMLNGDSPDCPPIDVTLDFKAPIASVVASKMNNKNCLPNVGSIVYLLSVNGVDVFMGGDLDESIVPYLEDDIFQHVNLIKIPHHGSEKTGDIHLKFGMNKCEQIHAATTVFTKCQDPKLHILEGYARNRAMVHCTGPKQGTSPDSMYGCIHYTYNLYTSQFDSIDLSGNAYQVF